VRATLLREDKLGSRPKLRDACRFDEPHDGRLLGENIQADNKAPPPVSSQATYAR
jgi:hypothetical protein